MRNHDQKAKAIKIIVDNIRYYRDQKGWTQEKLADHAKIDEKNLGKIERGVQEPYFLTLYKIASVLDVSLDSLSANLEHFIDIERSNGE